jgi:hypothetical protein
MPVLSTRSVSALLTRNQAPLRGQVLPRPRTRQWPGETPARRSQDLPATVTPTTPELVEARRQLREERLAEAIKRTVEAAHPLSAEAHNRPATLLLDGPTWHGPGAGKRRGVPALTRCTRERREAVAQLQLRVSLGVHEGRRGPVDPRRLGQHWSRPSRSGGTPTPRGPGD